MVKVYPNTSEEFYMDGYLKNNLDTAKKVIQKDWDMVFCIDGIEGSGKSVLAMQCAKYCDPSFTVDRVVFTAYEFRKAIIESKPYQAVSYDEAYTGLSSRATMSVINRTLVSMLAEIRQKNLFVFIVMPTFFDLDKYAALWRSRALLHVYTGENFKRGFFAFYNSDAKKALYLAGKKTYSYGKIKPNFIGRFTDSYVVDEKEYRKKKKDSLVVREQKREEKEIRRQVQEELFERLMTFDPENDLVTNRVKAQIMGVSEVYYYRLLKQYKEKELDI